jgi:hypothetical protein
MVFGQEFSWYMTKSKLVRALATWQMEDICVVCMCEGRRTLEGPANSVWRWTRGSNPLSAAPHCIRAYDNNGRLNASESPSRSWAVHFSRMFSMSYSCLSDPLYVCFKSSLMCQYPLAYFCKGWDDCTIFMSLLWLGSILYFKQSNL